MNGTTEMDTYRACLSALSLLSALEETAVMVRRPDQRMEVRYLNRVLLEAPGCKRIESYVIDNDGIEMFQGYLDDRSCPDRIECLKLWVEGCLNAQRRGTYHTAPLY